MLNVEVAALGTPMRMEFLVRDDVVFGVSTGSHKLAEKIDMPFAQLDLDPRKSFIDTMTSLWSQEEDSTPEEMKYRSAAVKFIVSGKIIDCGGALVAQEFVLTTALCIQHYVTTDVLHRLNSDVAIVSILQSEVMIHALYQSSDKSTLRYNLAILKLKLAQPKGTSVALAPFEFPVGREVVRVDLSGGSHVTSVKVLEENRCGGFSSTVPANKTILPSGILCAGNESVAIGATTSSSAALLGTFRGSIVLIGLQVGPDDGPYTDSYVSILAAANFINAYAYGQLWRIPLPEKPIEDGVRFGYMVGLQMKKGGQKFCGGALIASQFVLTAAHCISDGLVKWVSFESRETVRVLVDRIDIHPKFKSPNIYSFDAAILELATPAYSSPISLLDNATDYEDKMKLHQLKLPLWSQKKCQVSVPGVDENTVCAGGREGQDVYTGDSGSPLVFHRNFGEDVLVGLVSAGYGCGQAGVPGLYTRVSSILDFIEAYIAPAPSGTGSPRLTVEDTAKPSATPCAPSISGVPAASITSAPSPAPKTHGSGSKGGDGSGSSSTLDKNQSGDEKSPKADGKFPNAIDHHMHPSSQPSRKQNRPSSTWKQGRASSIQGATRSADGSFE